MGCDDLETTGAEVPVTSIRCSAYRQADIFIRYC